MVAAAIIGGAVVAGGGAIIAGGIQSKAAKKAGSAQERAALAGIEEERRQFDIGLELGAPRREAETEALASLRSLLGLGGEAPDFTAFEQAPGFQFTRDEALQAVERSAAARGGFAGGGTFAALQNRAAGLAGQNFLQNFLQPTLQLATGGAGLQAGQQAINLGVNVAGGLERAGAARASGIAGAGGARAGALGNLNQAIQGGLGNFLLFNQLGRGGTPGFDPGFDQPNQGFPTTFPGVA